MCVVDVQTLEAIISFTFFLFFATYMLAELDYTKPNYSLYQYQLANDAWRVLYLKGSLKDFSLLNRGVAEATMTKIYDETGLCTYLQGVITTAEGCRGGPPCSELKITMKKTWFENGRPTQMAFTVCTPES